jgi:hypothetical protein
MEQPLVIHGTGAELFAILERYRDRSDLTLIIPPDGEAGNPGSARSRAELAAANARLRRHIVSLPCPPDLDNESIDADLAREYAATHADTGEE